MKPNAGKNILVLMADQMTPSSLRPYGNTVSKTPRIDALASEGVVFDSAYCASPLCAPSRFAFMAGKLPSKIGAYDNAAELPAQTLTFAHYLRAAGYRTVLSGKMHFCGPDQLHGFEERLTTDIYPADFGWVPDWDHPERRPSWYHNMSSVLDAGPCVRTNQLDFDDEVTFTVRQKLYDIARERQAGSDARPFCIVASLTHPHDPYAIPAAYWDLYRDADIDMPRTTLGYDESDPHSRRLRHVCENDRTPPSEQQVRNARRAYYGALSYVDSQFGAMLDALKATGMADDTVVIVTSDHGDMLGERGLWYKMTFFENAARVPLIVHAPGQFAPHRVAASVSTIDLLPTLVELATGRRETAWPDPVDGRSLLPHLHSDGGHDEVFGEYLAEGALAPMMMIRRGRYKFIHTPADPDQLFDLEADPRELTNLARDPAYAATVGALRAEVAQRWNVQALHEAVLASQRRRRFHYEATTQGRIRSWDWQPFADASQRYMRNHIELDTLEAMARFPRVAHE
ncbi:choline-sulfatase [Trinickia caryophylli]|uniref:Choline-sulfatase n=1 Tax=Trinickia caryophylli TaxID=28094 RepID=A0A1X7FUA8_TRICW|nr:choline-sulfatase [Trinickia caryophylli]PMS11862.1 choline-sulfatase [Trinickia caryophylli]TRX14062.1 choline-sulfatase [Trinickia caryophylli]WQE13880.1 choline-sulfatase [Trinickia caryophylli]SMF58922.1 choline-sulfatase [Trinickia caryophylli]GLU33569.1 choline-sulfatase [Trinickia caryophylli]